MRGFFCSEIADRIIAWTAPVLLVIGIGVNLYELGLERGKAEAAQAMPAGAVKCRIDKDGRTCWGKA